MKTKLLGVAAIGFALAGCVEMGDAPPSSAPRLLSPVGQEAACAEALQTEVGPSVIEVMGSDPIGGQRDVTLRLNGIGIWRCVVSPVGTVNQLSPLTQDGSDLA